MILAITGGTGTLGHVLVDQLAPFYDKIIVISRGEYKQWKMEKDAPDNVRFMLCDVRDKCRLQMILKGVDHVVHAAALKQIDRCGYNPTEAVATNIDGSCNVVRACLAAGASKAVLVSTDKAVNPVNLYGATKLVAEKLFLAANSFNKTQFSAVRYGNVLNSRGSIVEKVLDCKEKKEKVPLTDERMTRFWMEKENAGKLIKYALGSQEIGVFVPTIANYTVHRLCRTLYPNCEFEIIGIRPGEKLHELLCTEGQSVFKVNKDFTDHKVHEGPWRSNEKKEEKPKEKPCRDGHGQSYTGPGREAHGLHG